MRRQFRMKSRSKWAQQYAVGLANYLIARVHGRRHFVNLNLTHKESTKQLRKSTYLHVEPKLTNAVESLYDYLPNTRRIKHISLIKRNKNCFRRWSGEITFHSVDHIKELTCQRSAGFGAIVY